MTKAKNGTTVDLAALILAADDLPREVVAVPEWGGVKVEVRGMTAADRDRYIGLLRAQIAGGGGETVRVEGELRDLILSVALHDPATGARLFDAETVGRLAAKNWKPLDRLMKAALALNGDTAEAQADAEKNSGTTTSGDSTSA